MTTAVPEATSFRSPSGGGRSPWLRPRMWLTPLIALAIGVAVIVWIASQDFTTPGRAPEGRALAADSLFANFREHAYLVALSTLLVVVVAIPVGVLLSRRSAGRVGDAVLAIGGFLQALPSFGVIILMAASPLGYGAPSAIIALAIASFLPVLANTVTGLRQVDPALIEAARGIGMSSVLTLWRVELPLAVPVMVAGIRVALVLNVGTATLATYIGAGGLGTPILSMLNLGRTEAAFAAAALVAALALFVDWLAGLAEQLVRGADA